MQNKKKCKKVIKTKGGSTSGLIRHLKNAHNIDPKLDMNPKQKKLETCTTIFPECYEKDIISLICKDLIAPNNIATNSVLRKWCHNFWGINLPTTPKGIWCQLERYFDDAKSRIIQSLKKENQISLTADEWTSSAGKRYLNLYVHTKDSKYSLGVARILKSANGEYLASLIEGKLREFGISNAHFITTDAATVMKTTAAKCGLLQQQCFLHAINLAVRDVFYTQVIFLH